MFEPEISPGQLLRTFDKKEFETICLNSLPGERLLYWWLRAQIAAACNYLHLLKEGRERLVPGKVLHGRVPGTHQEDCPEHWGGSIPVRSTVFDADKCAAPQ